MQCAMQEQVPEYERVMALDAAEEAYLRMALAPAAERRRILHLQEVRAMMGAADRWFAEVDDRDTYRLRHGDGPPPAAAHPP